MRKRDLAILLLSAFAIFFSLQNEGNFSFREGWFHLADDSYPFKHEADRLPPPLVTDLNGDGRKEVLIATFDAEIQVIDPHHRGIDDGFSEARVLGKISLLPQKVRVPAGRLPVAMAVGSIQRTYRDGDAVKQILVVVTAGWNVICYDHNLKKLWEESLEDDFHSEARHKEVSILISNYTLRHGDTGLVIVGGSMEVQPELFLDPFEQEKVSEKRAEHHRRAADDGENIDRNTVERPHHMHYYAFAGRTGARRWTHKSEDYQRSSKSELIPQHNYKLDVNSLNVQQNGEMECREFRESVLGVMPHRWERREDTKFELAHFRKHKRRTHKKLPAKSSLLGHNKPDDIQKPGKDTQNKISNVIGKAAEIAKTARPQKRALYYPTISNHTQLWWVPNVAVAHLKEGIEAIHLASGRTVCKLFLQEGALHADVNGDGVLDHVQAVGGGGSKQFSSEGLTETIKPCTAVAMSGVPVREQLFNVSICRHYPFGGSQIRFGRFEESNPLEVVTPVLLPTNDGHKHRKGSHGDLIFLNSRGEVTSYTPGLHGEAMLRWQVHTGATWADNPFQAGVSMERVVPTLEVLSLRVHGHPELILVAGEYEAVLISPGGSQLANFYLPSPPTHKLVVADFSGDGLNDVVLVTSNGVYGFVQVQQPGALLFSSLVGLLVIVMCIIFVVQHFSLSEANKKPYGR